jgi:hypothetical protein
MSVSWAPEARVSGLPLRQGATGWTCSFWTRSSSPQTITPAYSGGGLRRSRHPFECLHENFDSPREHFEAALVHGEYLNDQELIETLCYDAPARVLELKDFGVEHFRDLYLKVPYPHGTGIVKPLLETGRRWGSNEAWSRRGGADCSEGRCERIMGIRYL